MAQTFTKVMLCILDGWGINPCPEHNGISLAHTPVWKELLEKYPSCELEASELYVGLPSGQMGNSEVGHMTIGSGRVILQDLPRIDKAFKEDTIKNLPLFQSFVTASLQTTKTVHLLGLLSPGGVHSHQDHLINLAKLLSEQGCSVYVHAFLDGRDTPPKSAADYMQTFLAAIKPLKGVQIATFCGRYYGMDRDQRWERTERAYQVIVHGQGEKAERDPVKSILASYAQEITDEFIVPHVSLGYRGMQEGDSLMMANFRADRVRQLLTSLLDPTFNKFPRPKTVSFAATLGLTPYSEGLKKWMPILFDKQPIQMSLGETIAQADLKQLRVAETEKYAHVTFFFNGGREEVFKGEERKLIASPKVATYDLQPEMSAFEMTDFLVDQIHCQQYALMVVNYANADMVGHTGVESAVVKAIEAVDQCLGRVLRACEQTDTVFILTADHGNAEQMVDPETGQPHTSHTLNRVPFIVANAKKSLKLAQGGLENIAPTVLEIMGLPQPIEMTGLSLIKEQKSD